MENFQFRQSDKKLVPVKVELWYRSCFGATVDSWSTFSKAIILAKIKEVAPPAVQDLSNTDPYMPYFPSVLRPVPSTSTSTLQDVGPPARRRRASSLSGSSTLPTLPSLSCAFGGTLPPLPSSLSMSGNDLQPLQHPAPGGNIASLPPLPGLHTPSRKRRTSTTSFLHPNPFESTSDASIWPSSSRPRLRSNLNGDPLPFPSPFEAPHFPPIPRPLSRNRR